MSRSSVRRGEVGGKAKARLCSLLLARSRDLDFFLGKWTDGWIRAGGINPVCGK